MAGGGGVPVGEEGGAEPPTTIGEGTTKTDTGNPQPKIRDTMHGVQTDSDSCLYKFISKKYSVEPYSKHGHNSHKHKDKSSRKARLSLKKLGNDNQGSVDPKYNSGLSHRTRVNTIPDLQTPPLHYNQEQSRLISEISFVKKQLQGWRAASTPPYSWFQRKTVGRDP